MTVYTFRLTNLVKFLFILCFFCTHAAYSHEEFYVFDVGQGNCQLAVFPENESSNDHVGILFDAGTGSSMKHCKYQNFQRGEEEWIKYYAVNDDKIYESILSDDEALGQTPAQKDPQPRSTAVSDFSTSFKRRLFEESTDRRVTGSVARSSVKETKSTIHDTIADLKLKHLILFLSHPDNDHINFATQGGIIPEGLPVTAFLCGEWLGAPAYNTDQTNLSEPVHRVLSFLLNRDDTRVEIPFYWGLDFEEDDVAQTNLAGASSTSIISGDGKEEEGGFEEDEASSTSGVLDNEEDFCYNKLMEELKLLFNSNVNVDRREESSKIADLDAMRLNAHTPSFFRGDLSTLFRERRVNSEINFDIKKFGKNVFLWGLNHSPNDANAQSLVASCTFLDLKLSIVMTGDADQSSFRRVAEETKRSRNGRRTSNINGLRKQYKKMLPLKEHLVFLTLPHHGSAHNESDVMNRFFRPNGLLISAGNGGQFKHPELSYLRKYKDKKHFADAALFYERYHQLAMPSCLGFTNGEEGYRGSFIKNEPDNSMPILSTNVHGSIRINFDGIFQQHASTFTHKGETYQVILEEHVSHFTREPGEKIKVKFDADGNKVKKVPYDEVECDSLPDSLFLFHNSKQKGNYPAFLVVIPVDNELWYVYKVRKIFYQHASTFIHEEKTYQIVLEEPVSRFTTEPGERIKVKFDANRGRGKMIIYSKVESDSLPENSFLFHNSKPKNNPEFLVVTPVENGLWCAYRVLQINLNENE